MPRTRSGKLSHAAYVASLAQRTQELEQLLASERLENVSLRRHAASTDRGREILARLRDRRIVKRQTWIDQTRDRPRDVP
jgi:hypothetical protein